MAGADLKARIVAEAKRLGFDPVRVTGPTLPPEAGTRLQDFLDAGAHGTMGWLARDPERRASPDALWPEARSALVLGTSYAPDGDALEALGRPSSGAVSVYARGRDYHDVIKSRLKALGRWLGRETGAELKVFIDTAPILEKPLAERAGVGWQGKHTNLVSRTHGSWLFLAEILTTLELEPDAPEADHCGTCRRCLDVCPTDAFPAPYRLDARRCISYLTIEHAGPIPEEFRAAIGNRIYGCDDCLAVCPWNKFAEAAHDLALAPRPDLAAPSLAMLAELDDAAFRRFFSGSPIKRIGRDRFVRNVLIAIGNSGERALLPAAAARTEDSSEVVRETARWAVERLEGSPITLGAH